VASESWNYTDAAGQMRRVKLCRDKTASKQMLAKRETDAALARNGLADPDRQEHQQRPLAEHIEEWEAALRAGGAGDKHARTAARYVRRIFDGCRFVFMADLTALRVQQFLAGLRERRPALPPLDPAKEGYRKRELAELLRVNPSAIPLLVRRHRLQASGKGKARRYPRAPAGALWSMRLKGISIKTSNDHLAAVKRFAIGW